MEQQKEKRATKRQRLLDMLIGSVACKDYGEHAWAGAQLANRRKHKQYLRSHHLGKFRKGKRK